jgi:putative flippase GtrA
MIDDTNNKEKKSPLQRFLFFIGILFLILYCTLGLLIIFWRDLPLQMEYHYRIAFGVILIVYAVIRFSRLLKQ